MGLQELRAGRPKMGVQELRLAACRGFETQDVVLRPKMGLQELRAGSLQGF